MLIFNHFDDNHILCILEQSSVVCALAYMCRSRRTADFIEHPWYLVKLSVIFIKKKSNPILLFTRLYDYCMAGGTEREGGGSQRSRSRTYGCATTCYLGGILGSWTTVQGSCIDVYLLWVVLLPSCDLVSKKLCTESHLVERKW